MAYNEKKISIIVPAFNEGNSIGQLIDEIKKSTNVHEILVIDDCSSDQTATIANKAGARVIRHPYNKGNGAAIKTGIRNARGDILVFMDADGQHDPAMINKLVENIDAYDMVVGARLNRRGESFYRNFANHIYNLLASYVSGKRIEDLTSGFRAIRRKVALKFVYLLPNGFSYPTTITISLIKAGYSVKYVPVQNRLRLLGRSKINIIKDGMKFFLIIFKVSCLFSPLRIFLPESILFFFLGLGRYLYTFLKNHTLTNMSVMLFVTSVIIFMLGLVAEQIAQSRMEWIDLFPEYSDK